MCRSDSVRFSCGILCGILSSAVGAAELRIVEPAPDEILYGRTTVVARVTATEGVGQVVFHVDRLEHPICRVSEMTFRCEFDAGKEFQGRSIRVVALDRRGSRIAEDRVETMGFPAPVEVVRHLVTVPVVASSANDDAVDLARIALGCEFIGQPCEVLESRRLTDAESTPLSIELLVDVSPSVRVQRDEFLDSVVRLVATFPDRAQVSISEFAGVYRRLGEFTQDRAALRAQVQRLSSNVPYTCLLRAIERSLTVLGERTGHKALFIISDGIDTCDATFSGPARAPRHRLDPGVLYHVVDVARASHVPIYIYRASNLPTTRGPVSIQGQYVWLDLSYEGLARETGGRLFATGDIYGLARSFDDLLIDFRSTWMIDILLPEGAVEGRPRRLGLTAASGSGVKLRYPEYWDPGSTEQARIANVDAEDGEVRLWAAQGLRGSRNVDALRALVDVLAIEPDDRLRAEQIESIREMTAHLLLHADLPRQRAAVDALAQLHGIDPRLLDPLQPMLRVFQKVDAPERLKRQTLPLVAARP